MRRNRQLIRPTRAPQSLEVDTDADWHTPSLTPEMNGNRVYSPRAQCRLTTHVIPSPMIPHMQQLATPPPAPEPDQPMTAPTVEYTQTRTGRISKPPLKLDL